MDPFPVPIPLDHQPPPPHHPPPTPPPPQPQPQQQQQQQPPVSFPPPPPPPLSIATAPAAAVPPFAEMIFAAITALKEKDGSSKMAIAKYIEQNYSNLPPNHSALLTQHLKRLKSTGHLVMVKKSYKLPPRSDALVPTILPNNHQQNAFPPPPPAQLPKTGRGRGRPPKSPNAVRAQPVLVSVGLVDQHPPTQQQQLTPGKRGRGRPKKIGGPAVVQKVSAASGKRPGRPKKLKPVRANFGPNGVAQVHAQAQAEAQPISYAYSEGNVPLQNVGAPRGRGRPKKLGPGVAAAAATAKPKPVGRPAGRPVGRPKKSKSRSGRPVGRPRKITTDAAGAQAVSTIGDLRRKLEFFQTKVKLVVDVLKPQLTGESQISAVAAIQELEGLATMDLTAPLREDAQQQPQPQQPVQVQN